MTGEVVGLDAVDALSFSATEVGSFVGLRKLGFICS